MKASLRMQSFRPLLAASALACCAAAQAQSQLHFKCNTTMTFGPSHCPGTIAPIQDHSPLDIDLEQKVWRSDHMTGPITTDGKLITLQKWGAGTAGRDATLDSSTGAFNYHLESGCLVETQTGVCEAVPTP